MKAKGIEKDQLEADLKDVEDKVQAEDTFSKENILKILRDMITCIFCKKVQRDGNIEVCCKKHIFCRQCSRSTFYTFFFLWNV